VHPEVSAARARVAALSRCVNTGERDADDPAINDARRELNAANLEAAVLKALAKAPQPTDEQLQRIAQVLLAGGAPANRKAVVAERVAELDGGGDHAA
jgi:hypothetical protein